MFDVPFRHRMKGDTNMRTSISTAVLAVCLSAGVAFAQDPAPKATGSLPQGITAKELNDQQDIRATLASATNASLTKGGFNDLLERFSSADRKRFEGQSKMDTTELDGRIEQIQKIWKEKYGKAFDFDDDKILSSFLVVREGEIADPAVAKMHWPVMVTERTEGEAQRASAVASGDYLVKGRNVALVTVPASHGMPAMTLSMLHEPVDDWRIDIPDGVSREMIYKNLKDRLTSFGENVDKWPGDVNEAYRHVAHSVFAAFSNVTAMNESGRPTDTAPFPPRQPQR
jgi:hypothetical protein